MTNRKKFILIMSFILLCGGCAKEDTSTPELSSEKDTEETLTTSVLETQTDVSKEEQTDISEEEQTDVSEEEQTDVSQEEQEGFSLCYDGKDTGLWIPFRDCVCEYDDDGIFVYSYYLQNGYEQGISLPYFRYALYIQTPEDTMQIYPVKDFLVDAEAGSLYMVWEEGTFERVQGIDFVKNQDDLGGYKMISTSSLEEWIGNAYGLAMDAIEMNFTDLHAALEEIDAENGERILKGTASGIYKNTGKKYYIDWEINRTTGEEQVRSYLLNRGIPSLYMRFLYGDITVQNPFAQGMEEYDRTLGFFDDEKYAKRETVFHTAYKNFALSDADGDGEEELLFRIKGKNSPDELIYILKERAGELICFDVFENHSAHATGGEDWLCAEYGLEDIAWSDCADFADIPKEDPGDVLDRGEVFRQIEQGDYSSLENEEEKVQLENAYAVISEHDGKWRLADVNGDGMEELILQSEVQYRGSIRPIDYILTYVSGKTEIVYRDLNDATEFLFLGKEDRLIYYNQFYGVYAWNGYTECRFDAKWNLEKISGLEIYGLSDLDSYDEEELAWIKEHLPENVRQEGCCFYKDRLKTPEELQAGDNEEFWTEEPLSQAQFLEEYENMTGRDFRKDNPDWEGKL